MECIIERCLPWRYGDEYVPAFRATRAEGMAISRIGRLPMANFRRDLHPQSAAEAAVMCWVMYQPDFLEALENRPCCPVPGLPILSGHPLAISADLKPSSGTAAIAEIIGVKHPKTVDDVWQQRGEDRPRRDYYPLVSDLLAIFHGSFGIRAVNLFVKKTAKEFELLERSKDLFELEASYYAEADIPTFKVSPDQLHPIVTTNLLVCATRARRPAGVNIEQLQHALSFMKNRIYSSAPVSWERELWERLGLIPETQEWIFHYGVFHRHLRVDLGKILARDMVHKPERVNYAADFAARFLQPL